jgi:hypothetical protein
MPPLRRGAAARDGFAPATPAMYQVGTTVTIANDRMRGSIRPLNRCGRHPGKALGRSVVKYLRHKLPLVNVAGDPLDDFDSSGDLRTSARRVIYTLLASIPSRGRCAASVHP